MTAGLSSPGKALPVYIYWGNWRPVYTFRSYQPAVRRTKPLPVYYKILLAARPWDLGFALTLRGNSHVHGQQVDCDA